MNSQDSVEDFNLFMMCGFFYLAHLDWSIPFKGYQAYLFLLIFFRISIYKANAAVQSCIEHVKELSWAFCDMIIFVEPPCGERDIVVTLSVRCMCMCCACVHLSGFVWAITSTFMHRFQNDLAQLFSLRSKSAI